MLQGQPVQKLHRDERIAMLILNFVDGADVRVVQSGSSTSLAAEAFQRLGVICKVFGQEFQSDESPKFGVLGFVDDTHPAAAQLLNDAVVRDGFADHGWRRTQGAMLGMRRGRVNENAHQSHRWTRKGQMQRFQAIRNKTLPSGDGRVPFGIRSRYFLRK